MIWSYWTGPVDAKHVTRTWHRVCTSIALGTCYQSMLHAPTHTQRLKEGRYREYNDKSAP